jgi:DNA-binding transcriptional regulator PaaX
MFGEEDVVNNRKATTSIYCLSSEAVLYCIAREEFLDKMKSNANDRSWQMIIKYVYEKDVETKIRISNSMYQYHSQGNTDDDMGHVENIEIKNMQN